MRRGNVMTRTLQCCGLAWSEERRERMHHDDNEKKFGNNTTVVYTEHEKYRRAMT